MVLVLHRRGDIPSRVCLEYHAFCWSGDGNGKYATNIYIYLIATILIIRVKCNGTNFHDLYVVVGDCIADVEECS